MYVLTIYGTPHVVVELAIASHASALQALGMKKATVVVHVGGSAAGRGLNGYRQDIYTILNNLSDLREHHYRDRLSAG